MLLMKIQKMALREFCFFLFITHSFLGYVDYSGLHGFCACSYTNNNDNNQADFHCN